MLRPERVRPRRFSFATVVVAAILGLALSGPPASQLFSPRPAEAQGAQQTFPTFHVKPGAWLSTGVKMEKGDFFIVDAAGAITRKSDGQGFRPPGASTLGFFSYSIKAKFGSTLVDMGGFAMRQGRYQGPVPETAEMLLGISRTYEPEPADAQNFDGEYTVDLTYVHFGPPPPTTCPTPDPSPGKAGIIYSTPKDQEHYTFPAPIALPNPAANSANEIKLLNQVGNGGRIQIAFAWQDQARQRHSVCFDKPVGSAYNLSPERQQQAQDAGEASTRHTSFPGFWDYEGLALDIRYAVLDQLEKIVKDPENGQQTFDAKKGEQIFRGNRLAFDTQIFIYDSAGTLMGKTDPANNIRLIYQIRHPVVFVPGTAGSRLSASGGEVWPHFDPGSGESAKQSWAPLRLEDSGQGPRVAATDVFRSYIICTEFLSKGCIYNLFLDHMEAPVDASVASGGYVEDKSLFLFPYDWRLDITLHPLPLDRLVDRALDMNFNRKAVNWNPGNRPQFQRAADDKVVIITHSQGGLVARAYLADQTRAKKVAYLIQLAPTNYGSEKAFKAVGNTGYSFEAPFLNPEVGKWMARNYPAAYFQFPVTTSGSGDFEHFLFDASGKPVQDVRAELAGMVTHQFCYNPSGGFAPFCEKTTMNMKVADAAVAFHKSLPSPVSMGVPTYVIAGFDQETILGYRRTTMRQSVSKSRLQRFVPNGGFQATIPADALRQIGAIPPEVLDQAGGYKLVGEDAESYFVELPYYAELRQRCGDNLVPLHSAVSLPGVEPIYVGGVTHGTITEGPVVQGIIDRLLQGVRPVAEPKPACNSMPAAANQSISITTQSSPANVHVYDSQGRHTGLNAQGNIERGIPGSDFDNRGGTQQVWLPSADQQFRVVLEGVVTTDVDLRITVGDGQSEKTVEYLAIPETKAMRAEIRFTPGTLSANTAIIIDRNGDGKSTEARQPNFLNGAAVPRSAAPLTTPTLGATPVQRPTIVMPAETPATGAQATPRSGEMLATATPGFQPIPPAPAIGPYGSSPRPGMDRDYATPARKGGGGCNASAAGGPLDIGWAFHGMLYLGIIVIAARKLPGRRR